MSNNFKSSDSGRIVAGIILVCVGAALLLREMGFFFPRWIFSWPMILILVGFYTGVKNNFRTNSWIYMLAIGGFFLFNQMIPSLRLQPYFWPILVMSAGLVFILRPRSQKDNELPTDNDQLRWQDPGTGEAQPPTFTGIADNSDFLRVSSVFSGVNRTVLSKNFKGANITCVFGGSEINLSQADLTGPVIIKTEVVFGGVKLIVPPHWAVQNEIDGIFHGVDDKRRINVAPDLNPTKVIILRGSVVFGGIEIKNPRI
ncbi:MAG: DUF5668 domain-containing protein [Bacteroidota bacterium]